MKNENLPEKIDNENPPFNFKRQLVSDEDIRKHWDRIATRIFSGGEAEYPLEPKDNKGENKA
ncbi:hypothetical protein SRABI27_04749 [Pedobacter sp. Bi27]|uniref:hypothetical protein n=1 Tax=unclassified Pedobacter TaxID=2628915 RepID=UPI001DAD8EFA|nr:MULTISPECIES: hypothetical protein [unclassified Pedobacter]CAH0274330.1 hypothetical protein SRABI36_03830 [Pedobacter sp. Bi36]CAH0297387.1 hypothetical protein SRABI126_04253 [Pedobacter sp. Bi126]CAH0310270.1 hypothetical protein SRABI27_04749 [Pedobacter sp. Bi27]